MSDTKMNNQPDETGMQRKQWEKPVLVDLDGQIEALFGPVFDGGESITS